MGANALFLTLIATIVLLLVVILVLAEVVRGVAQLEGDKKDNAKKLLFLPLVAVHSIGGVPQGIFYLLTGVIAFEMLLIIVLLNTIRMLLGTDEHKAKEAVGLVSKTENEFPALLDKLNASVAIEKEADILLDHNYDGIQELDNDLPPWWKYGFYLTIVFAVCYMFYFHVSKSGNLQVAEYNEEMKKAELDLSEFMKKSANMVDETNVHLLTDAATLGKGGKFFTETCSPCHGKNGQGIVGPNLTDEYWLHGGSIKDIFKTIKYGYPEKGMKSWKEEFSPLQIASIASYIKSIRGTNPAGAKPPQGELYVEPAVSGDSTAVKTGKP
jgi:cytochrome c oxidase cbb3-type subunit 3